jgi:RimJ/RimL family protein N-acetyltransferase
MAGPVFLASDDGEVVLRPRQAEDAEFVRDNVNHPDVRRLLRNDRPKNVPAIETEYEERLPDSDDGYGFVVCARGDEDPDGLDAGADSADSAESADSGAGDGSDNGPDAEAVPDFEPDDYPDERVGHVALWRVDHVNGTAWLGIWIAADHLHEGYGPRASALAVEYAFAELNLLKVRAAVFEPNRPSRRMMEKLGFTREGVDRKATYIDGERHDSYLFGLLREEWAAEDWPGAEYL